ncbi:MAG: methylenetetrahydrofolate--tRNA-(uracil(54)-C(5))-methyltransferase (FADH(2)-oxidizing) TrmFO [Oscillospiraceae bacterium]|nr:methylenetetrahydrofolate--tRNA-(uracil(54)-C(5))-methyltransferase (FADH(2)-oxidizing) TrmFO [Oscillospiraceae bacterium]
MTLNVVGAGLAGVEAANTLAGYGHRVNLFEMKPKHYSQAHHSPDFAELVCSNSFKAARVDSASGLLKAEARLLGSLVLEVADHCSVPAGGAVAVNREIFSKLITERITQNSNISVITEQVTDIDTDIPTIIASGPLTSGALAANITELTGGLLNFYDAASPILTAESIDFCRVFSANRYDPSTKGDYLNCFFDKSSYEAFWNELVNAKTATLSEFDTPTRVYEGCIPIEKLAKRGIDSIRFGPLKPVGLVDPVTERRPYAVVQLRKEDNEARLYNMVGFQTNLTFQEQKRVFSLIPGLEKLEIVRYGVMHRNSYLDSPKLLNVTLNLRDYPSTYIAGQLTGFEGYIESAVSGILAARFLHGNLTSAATAIPSEYTMSGALLRYIISCNKDFQPMGANMGILPPLESPIKNKKQRYMALAERAITEMNRYISP